MVSTTQLNQLIGLEVFEQLPDAILMVDLHGTIKYANAQARQLFSQENLVSASVETLLPEHLRERHVGHRMRFALEPRTRPMGAGLDLAGRRADGTTFPVDIMLNPIEHDGESMVIAVVRDVTERRATEETARRNWAMFELLFESSPDAIFVVDELGRIDRVNSAAESAFQLSRERMLGQAVERLIPERFRSRHVEHRTSYMRHPSSRPMGRGLDLWALRADGSEFPIDIMLAPIGFEQRRFALAVLRDVTERRRAEDHLKLAMREVNHRTKNILSVVQAMARRALVKSTEEFISRFAERIQSLSASHDLLVRHEWKSIQLPELVHLLLSHLGDVLETRISTQGPNLRINALAAQAIGMALHELATNATKYGALSNEEGHVNIMWRLKRAEGHRDRFSMEWSESGGPMVSAPTEHGFGWTVLYEMMNMSLGAETRLEFPPSGLVWRIECPVDNIFESAAEVEKSLLPIL